MGDAASRLAGGSLGPWLPQAASTQCLAKFGSGQLCWYGLRATPRRAVELYAERASRRQPVVQERPFRRVAFLGEPPRWHVMPCCEPAFVPWVF
jgi:hypothetical protein